MAAPAFFEYFAEANRAREMLEAKLPAELIDFTSGLEACLLGLTRGTTRAHNEKMQEEINKSKRKK